MPPCIIHQDSVGLAPPYLYLPRASFIFSANLSLANPLHLHLKLPRGASYQLILGSGVLTGPAGVIIIVATLWC